MQLTQKITTAFIMLALLLSGLTLSASVASAHNGEDHSDEHAEEMTPQVKIAMMEEMVKLLQEVVELLEEKAALHAGVAHGHDESNTHTLATLSISVEEHGGRTHIHVNEPGKEEVTFFLDDIAIEDEDEVIAAIAEETGLSEAEVEAAATFPEHHDEHEDEVHESHAGMEGLDGIHIMADGTIMLGNGAVVTDATINDDDMIVLGDGTLVEPEIDMR